MKIVYFAHIARALDRREDELPAPAPLNATALWEQLVARHPALAPFHSSVKFIRNGDYARPGEVFADGDEVGLLPPVSGG